MGLWDWIKNETSNVVHWSENELSQLPGQIKSAAVKSVNWIEGAGTTVINSAPVKTIEGVILSPYHTMQSISNISTAVEKGSEVLVNRAPEIASGGINMVTGLESGISNVGKYGPMILLAVGGLILYNNFKKDKY